MSGLGDAGWVDNALASGLSRQVDEASAVSGKRIAMPNSQLRNQRVRAGKSPIQAASRRFRRIGEDMAENIDNLTIQWCKMLQTAEMTITVFRLHDAHHIRNFISGSA
jgi:hypothetical protein